MANSKRNYSSTDFFKNREGPKRQARMNEWYMDKKGHKEAQDFFSATKDGVPNNPTNYQTFTPIASKFAPNSESDADVVFRRNPYGDAEQIEQSQGPTYQRPTQWGSYNRGSDIAKDVDKPNFLSCVWYTWSGTPKESLELVKSLSKKLLIYCAQISLTDA